MNNLIKKIEIFSFRSIEKLSINVMELNVFSGSNDAGKSNVLKALNLFFNSQTDFLKPLRFEDDYNKVSRAKMLRSSKMKQLIKIRIYINPPSSYKTLQNEKSVYVERQFDRNGERIERYSTEENKKKSSIKRIVNKVKYIYIPALKGEDVLQYLLTLIGEHQLIEEKEITKLNSSILSKTKDLKEILTNSGIPIGTSFGLPVFLADFWQKLSVNTEYENLEILNEKIKGSNNNSLNPAQFTISLMFRGEGIKSKYIPPLLNWLDKNDKSKEFIWGIDEPENSLEFDLADKLSMLYFNNYSVSNQIFLTTHSLAFINPPDDVIIKPLVFKTSKDDYGRTKLKNINDLFEKQNRIELFEELGVLQAQKELIQEYRASILKISKLENIITQYTKPKIIVEGKTDKWIIEKAWEKIKPGEEQPFDVCPSGCYIDEEKSEGGAKQVKTTLDFISSIAKEDQIIIGLFDNDKEGNEQLKGLNKNIFESHSLNRISRNHKTKKITGLLLPVPASRNIFVGNKINQRFMEIEHYFSDHVLGTHNLKGDKVAHDSQIFSINRNKKTDFAKKKLNDLDASEYDNFNVLFDKIIEIINT